MRLTRIYTVGSLLLFLMPNLASAQELVANGNFETNPPGEGYVAGDPIDGWSEYYFDAGDVGWTGLRLNWPVADSWEYYSGTYDVVTLHQYLATEVGGYYHLSYNLANESEGGGGSLFRPLLGGIAVKDPALNLADAGGFAYQPYTYDFVATSASTHLAFNAINAPGYWILDDVSVTKMGDAGVTNWTQELHGDTTIAYNAVGDLALAGGTLGLNINADKFKAGTYDLITYTGSLTGTFATVANLGAYVSGTGLNYGTGTNSAVTLTLLADLVAGDANLDGATNFSDYSVVATHYNQTGANLWRDGDVNGDGVVNFSDYSVIATNYGSAMVLGVGSPIVLQLQGVPEPGTLVLLGAGLLGLLCYAWRKRK